MHLLFQRVLSDQGHTYNSCFFISCLLSSLCPRNTGIPSGLWSVCSQNLVLLGETLSSEASGCPEDHSMSVCFCGALSWLYNFTRQPWPFFYKKKKKQPPFCFFTYYLYDELYLGICVHWSLFYQNADYNIMTPNIHGHGKTDVFISFMQIHGDRCSNTAGDPKILLRTQDQLFLPLSPHGTPFNFKVTTWPRQLLQLQS